MLYQVSIHPATVLGTLYMYVLLFIQHGKAARITHEACVVQIFVFWVLPVLVPRAMDQHLGSAHHLSRPHLLLPPHRYVQLPLLNVYTYV